MENKTMTTIEHLNKIKSKCEQLLAIAEKRTHGRWKEDRDTEIWSDSSDWIANCVDSNYDAAFIASCAGSAEAGWRSTIALINMLFSLPSWVIPEVDHPETVSALLSAWPEELL